ncbi:hypothetical protein BAUCODRAFT_265046 [Baudoinia panamericana UAMH 10762]|uniref:Uncharacterized protein n=1 Tax=Baudoinia panamericana (strain UAMH 10762) TaxID=717646 RepID=M2N1N7_BAUPA|nr:uncharacterized protein BAUCODRAFT_265046 [Baudoinia panamericana UAMH 10762]EMC92874.1 hypothetical protein BAUCODRAFT_265046 [Baudoinia panamericana UAMH 10762]
MLTECTNEEATLDVVAGGQVCRKRQVLDHPFALSVAAAALGNNVPYAPTAPDSYEVRFGSAFSDGSNAMSTSRCRNCQARLVTVHARSARSSNATQKGYSSQLGRG